MIVFDDREHGDQIAKAAGFDWDPQHSHVISSVGNSGKLLGGIIFERFMGSSIWSHCGSFGSNWVGKDLVWWCHYYPFVQLKVSKILGMAQSTNLKVLAFALKLGFHEVARVTDAYPDGDLVILEMCRDNPQTCRWLSLMPRSPF